MMHVKTKQKVLSNKLTIKNDSEVMNRLNVFFVDKSLKQMQFFLSQQLILLQCIIYAWKKRVKTFFCWTQLKDSIYKQIIAS